MGCVKGDQEGRKQGQGPKWVLKSLSIKPFYKKNRKLGPVSINTGIFLWEGSVCPPGWGVCAQIPSWYTFPIHIQVDRVEIPYFMEQESQNEHKQDRIVVDRFSK